MSNDSYNYRILFWQGYNSRHLITSALGKVMKKLLLGSLLFVISTSVLAETSQNIADFHWSGPYMGILAGPAWGNYKMKQSTIPDGYLTEASTAAINQAGDQSIHAKGYEAGIEVGYNLQKQQILFGIETDWQTLNLSGSTQSAAIPYPTNSTVMFNVGSFANNNWLFTLRPRVGFVTHNCLFYATGGLGLTQINSNYYFTDQSNALVSGSINTIKPGYALGAGMEFGITKRFSVKAEYLYVNFNSTNATATGNNLLLIHPDQVFKYSTSFNTSLIRIGLNYNLD